ncbi:MAG: OstA-like protein [Hymenobacter sp.]
MSKAQRTDLRNDTLTFNTISKIAYFDGPTRIKSAQGDLYAEKGTYNTVTRISNFARNAKIDTPGYLLGGDQLVYDERRSTAWRRATSRSFPRRTTSCCAATAAATGAALGRTKLYGAAGRWCAAFRARTPCIWPPTRC